MLKLKYDVKCGFNQLYIVEKDVEFDLSFMFTDAFDWGDVDQPTEESVYETYKDLHNYELIEALLGSDDILTSSIEYYAHTYFKRYCKENKCLPGIFEISNVDLVFSDGFESLRASEVMSILDITRPTLCHYVKRGLIKIDPNYTGKQYRYDAKSVYALLDGNKKH